MSADTPVPNGIPSEEIPGHDGFVPLGNIGGIAVDLGDARKIRADCQRIL